MKQPPPNVINTFLQEADDLISGVEATTLAVVETLAANGAVHEDAVNQIFRGLHTIKGSGAMAGFMELAAFTHHLETLLDQVREGQLPLSAQLARVVLAAIDQIKLFLQTGRSGPPVDADALAAVLDQVHQLSNSQPLPAPALASDNTPQAPSALTNWYIRFRPSPLMLARGSNPMLLFRELAGLGSCVLACHSGDLPLLPDLQPDRCYLWWDIALATSASLDQIRDVFIFENDAEIVIEQQPAVTSEADLGSVSATNAEPPRSALPAVTPAVAKESAAQPQQNRDAVVRVPSTKLDRLVGLVGELVMNQSRLAAAAARFQEPELAASVEEIERLVSDLRDDVLQIRMMPIGSIFGRFRRLVHDLSEQLGKEIALVTEGEDTELDKGILDQLSDALVHLIRNSIDHGIEPAAHRVAHGKPAKGTIRLAALHSGSDVVVTIEDDGRGLDRHAIREKAVARQMIAADATLSPKELFNLILLPGFSTAAQVTNLSGRGVGMDVVKRQIDALRGTLSLTSEYGRGTSVHLTLPLTLAIIDGLLVQIAGSQYIIPLSLVTENVELTGVDRTSRNGRNVVAVRGELIPYIDLRKEFDMGGTPPAISKIVLVRHEDQRVGFLVDRVLGTHQTVIQSLGKFFRGISVISGSTVMGDGRVALVLDVAGAVRLATDTGKAQVAPYRGPAPLAA